MVRHSSGRTSRGAGRPRRRRRALVGGALGRDERIDLALGDACAISILVQHVAVHLAGRRREDPRAGDALLRSVLANLVRADIGGAIALPNPAPQVLVDLIDPAVVVGDLASSGTPM